MSRRTRVLALVIVLALLGAGAGWWSREDTTPVPREGQTVASAQGDDASRPSDAPSTRDQASAHASIADTDAELAADRAVYTQGSLRDSTPDGRVTLGADGHVSVDVELRRRFDWYLAALGELDVARIRRVLAADLREQFGEGTAQAVLAIFDRYVGYQHARARLQALPDESLRDRFARERALRRQWLGETGAAAMFGEEEAYTEYTLARMDLARDTSIDATTRARRLAELEATLPAATREVMRDATSAALVDEQTRQFETLGLDDAQRRKEREALWGRDAARRLAALDRERAEWDARVARYVAARDALRREHRDAPARAEPLIAQLRARSFNETEARRVASLEAIGQL